MAKSGPSEEELQLRKRARRRLIGAIAVVLLVALFLPMVLDREPKPVTQSIEIDIPSPDKAGTFNSKIIALPPASTSPQPGAAAPAPEAPGSASVTPSSTPAAATAVAPPPVTAAAPAPAPAMTPVAPAPAPPAVAKPAPKAPEKAKTPDKPKSAAADKPKPVAKDKEKTKTPDKAAASAKGANWVVQVAALNDAAKAKQVQEQMTAAGVTTYTEMLPTAHGSVTRVRAGPYKTREEAEKARDKLKSLGLGGNVVPK